MRPKPSMGVLANMVLERKCWLFTMLLKKSDKSPQQRSIIPSNITKILTSYPSLRLCYNIYGHFR
jgi:hypothetical protein